MAMTKAKWATITTVRVRAAWAITAMVRAVGITMVATTAVLTKAGRAIGTDTWSVIGATTTSLAIGRAGRRRPPLDPLTSGYKAPAPPRRRLLLSRPQAIQRLPPPTSAPDSKTG